MNKKVIVALSIAVAFPLIAFFIFSYYGNQALTLPRKYYYDSVVTRTVDGKMIYDTAWHSVANEPFTNQLGNTVSLDSFKNKIVVINYFFTRCPSICPQLTANMKRVQKSYDKTDTIVRFISFTVDPQNDSVSQIKDYADRFHVRHDVWWMLTGDRKKIYDFAFNELKVAAGSEGPVDTGFLHTKLFVLLDRNHVVRGYYDGLDTLSLGKMINDIGLLHLEKQGTSLLQKKEDKD